MVTANTRARAPRAAETRSTILTVAERMYAELGVSAVSNRQVSEAAGQGNNTAVGYHFGTKADLVRAIVVKHAGRVDILRTEQLRKCSDSTELRDWITCLVRPSTDHLAELDSPSWYARFSAQVITDPLLCSIMYEESLASPSLQHTISGLRNCIPDLPRDVRSARSQMARTLLTHITAENEQVFAESGQDPLESWNDCGTDLIDAIVGLWEAPFSR